MQLGWWKQQFPYWYKFAFFTLKKRECSKELVCGFGMYWVLRSLAATVTFIRNGDGKPLQ
jgi:hypothetical protein